MAKQPREGHEHAGGHGEGVSAELRVMTGKLGRHEGEPTGFRVVGITGEEAVSELFSFDVVALMEADHLHHASEEHHGIEHELLMHEVAFRVGPFGNQRFGMISEVDVEGPFVIDERVFVRLRLRIVPRAWLLTQRRNSRIFQHKYVHEIVSQILHENGVRHRWDLSNTYPRRIYCTQYEETDYELVRRLLAEEGIFFFFEFWDEEHEDSPEFFKGGKPAKKEKTKSDWDKASKTLKGMNKIAKGSSAATWIARWWWARSTTAPTRRRRCCLSA